MGAVVGNPFRSSSKKRVFIGGADASGKTSLLYTLKQGAAYADGMHTVGFNVEDLGIASPAGVTVPMECWDVGGGAKMGPLYSHYLPTDALLYVVNARDHRVFSSAWELYILLQLNARANAPVLVVINTPAHVSPQVEASISGLCRVFSKDSLPPGGTSAWRCGWMRATERQLILTLIPVFAEDGILSVGCMNLAGVEIATLRVAFQERPSELHARVAEVLGLTEKETQLLVLTLRNGQILSLGEPVPVASVMERAEATDSGGASDGVRQCAEEFCDGVFLDSHFDADELHKDFLCDETPHGFRVKRDVASSPPLRSFHMGRWCVTTADVQNHIALSAAMAFLADAFAGRQ